MSSIIKITNLRKSYGTNEVLKGINLDIQKGDIVGYIGPNGSGKSTTVKILLSILTDYEGDIEIFGENIKNNPVKYKSKIGYVPEVAELYESLTPREFLNFLGGIYGIDESEIDTKAMQLMDIFGIKESYDSRISSFSKGMKQKVLIISSMIHNPDILFLDEPLSGLDANSVAVLKEILHQLSKKGKTIFYSSHIMDVVEKISSRIVLIKDGQILADGSFDELKNINLDSSLENIFNQLTGFNDHTDLAKKFVDIIGGE